MLILGVLMAILTNILQVHTKQGPNYSWAKYLTCINYIFIHDTCIFNKGNLGSRSMVGYGVV